MMKNILLSTKIYENAIIGVIFIQNYKSDQRNRKQKQDKYSNKKCVAVYSNTIVDLTFFSILSVRVYL